MSRAFVKEQDDVALEAPPDLLQGTGPNLMTEQGFAAIVARLAALEAELAGNPEEAAKNRLERDLRYWSARKAVAVIVRPGTNGTVAFGSVVTILRDGEQKTVTLVGEDETDPASGRINFRAPLAKALLGAAKGDVVLLENRDPPEAITVLNIGRP